MTEQDVSDFQFWTGKECADPQVRHLYTATEAQRVLGIKATTVRSWARRNLLYSFGLDQRNRPMYDRDHLVALRDKARSRAYNYEQKKMSRRLRQQPRDRPTE